MKSGKSLTELAQEIERQAEAKKDFIAPASRLTAVAEAEHGAPQVVLNLQGQEAFPITPYAHGQVAQYLEIPKKYYDRMLTDAPGILVQSINRWLEDHKDERRMIRTLDGNVRALLSDRYRPLENEDLAEAVFPVLAELGVQVVSADITERKFYVKAVDENIVKDIPTGHTMGDGTHTFFDTVSPAITLSNSEIGAGTLCIETSIWTKVCTNLATFGASLKKYHSGARADVSEEVYALLSDTTKNATDEAIWRQTRDITKAAFDQARFEALTKKLVEAGEDKIEDSPVEVVERARKQFTWTEGERDGVLKHLIKGGDLSRYGLHSAVTRAAEDLEDYDRASEFERLGGQIIELPRRDWQQIAKAA